MSSSLPMTRFAILLALILLGLMPVDGLACSCEPPDSDPAKAAKRSLESADAVFIGTVVKTELPESSSVQGPDYIQTTEFSVLKSWKGVNSDRFVTKINVTCCICGYRFEIGVTYLIFAHKRDDESYGASTCGQTAVLHYAEDLARALDDLAI